MAGSNSTLLRRLRRLWQQLLASKTKLGYRLLGLIEIAGTATIEHGARLETPVSSEREWCIRIGSGSLIKSGAYLGSRAGFISIGSDCSINPNCVLLGYGGISIGNGVRIASNTSIVAFNHNYKDPDLSINEQGNSWSGISIEDDVWIGTGVRILDGVTIGKGAVLAAGCVVTKSVKPYDVVAGVPAAPIMARSGNPQDI